MIFLIEMVVFVKLCVSRQEGVINSASVPCAARSGCIAVCTKGVAPVCTRCAAPVCSLSALRALYVLALRACRPFGAWS